MICEQNNCGQIVDRLVINFWSSNEKNLKNEEGTVTQDFRRRGFYNSTGRVTKLVSLNYQYLQNLRSELLSCLENDYSYVSPAKFQPELIRVVQTEYGRLAPQINRWLMESMLPNQLNVFQQGLIAEKEKAKHDIENKCAIWMERWSIRRKKKQWETAKRVLEKILIGVACAVIGWVLTTSISKHLWPKDNPAIQAPQIPQKDNPAVQAARMPQTPYRKSVRPTINQTKETPEKLGRPPQLQAVNEPNKSMTK